MASYLSSEIKKMVRALFPVFSLDGRGQAKLESAGDLAKLGEGETVEDDPRRCHPHRASPKLLAQQRLRILSPRREKAEAQNKIDKL